MKRLILAVVAAGVPGFILEPAPAGAAPSDDSTCQTTSVLARRAARFDARSEFMLRVAAMINAPDCDVATCLQKARDKQDEALAQADAQHVLRLAICERLDPGPYDPQLGRAEFAPTITSSYFPLVPGRTLIYEERSDAGVERVELTTLDQTVVIDGFPCRAIRSVETLDGALVERTIDWYAQRTNGDVWYFGELAKNYRNGFLENLDGSWRTGKDGAKPGIVMLGTPTLDATYREEFLIGIAEDVARVVSLDATVSVPYGTFEHCVQIEECSPLDEEEGAEWKYYAAGVGLLLEYIPSKGSRLELVGVVD